MEEAKRERIGMISVDAGLVMIGDPCYHHFPTDAPCSMGRSWGEFVDILFNNGMEHEGVTKLWHNKAGEGLGIVVGVSDGCYSVYAERSESGRIKRVSIDFE